jgi:hypothetical protein
MFKRMILVMVVVNVLCMLTESLCFAQKKRMLPGCEIGDAIFGKIHFGILTEPT